MKDNSERAREWREANKEYLRKRRREYYVAHYEREREQQRRYYRAKKDRQVVDRQRRTQLLYTEPIPEDVDRGNAS